MSSSAAPSMIGPTRVFYADTGSHDDEPTVRSCRLLVIPGAPKLSWRLIRPEDQCNALAQEIKDTLGGQVALQLIVKVAPQTRVAPSMNKVTLRLKEQEDIENSVKHAETEDHAEFDFDLNDSHGDVWEVKYDKSGLASTPVLKSRADAGAALVKAANTKPDTDVLYIRTVLRNNTTKLPTDSIFRAHSACDPSRHSDSVRSRQTLLRRGWYCARQKMLAKGESNGSRRRQTRFWTA